MEEKNSIIGKNAGIIAVLGIVLVVFVGAKTIKEFKSIPYVGKDVPVMNTITVNGEGEAFAIPDIATFTFTIEKESMVVSDAQQKLNKQVNDTLAFLKESGIDDKDVKTLGYNIYPRYEYPQIRCVTYPCPTGERRLAGYTVSQSVQVKIRKIADAGKIVDGVGETGATNVGGLVFDVEKKESVLREARQKAINDAQTKAAQLAKDLGVTLVRIVNYNEYGSPMPMYYSKAEGLGGGDMLARDASIPTGENEFNSNVNITYEIR